MSWSLQLRISDKTGITKFASLVPERCRFSLTKTGISSCVFSLRATDPSSVPSISEYDIVEVAVRNQFIGPTNWTTFFRGIIRGSRPACSTDSNRVHTFSWKALHFKHVLSWRRVLWFSDQVDRSYFEDADLETVIKTLILKNLFPGLELESPPRLTSGTLETWSISVAPNLNRGPLISPDCFTENLLELTDRLTDENNYDILFDWNEEAEVLVFDIEERRDLTAQGSAVLFSLESGTMANPNRTVSHSTHNKVLLGGDGEGQSRVYEEYSEASEFQMEEFVDVKSQDPLTFAQTALVRLRDGREIISITFDPVLSKYFFYNQAEVSNRTTFRVGDTVLVSYLGTVQAQIISEAHFSWENNDLVLSLKTEEV